MGQRKVLGCPFPHPSSLVSWVFRLTYGRIVLVRGAFCFMGQEVVLEMRGITKRFGEVVANGCVDFTLRSGEIHALLGENGAGKTTLMSIAYGLYQPDEGEILLRGRKVIIRSPRDALDLGVGMVHQHSMLIPCFTVAENIMLALKTSWNPFMDIRQVSGRITEVSARYGLNIDPGARVSQLSVGERQRVDILKALCRDVQVLILDEPTSVLTPVEVDRLMAMLREMASRDGVSIVLVTHKLPQVMAVSDRVTILRRGRVVDVFDTANTNEYELAQKMVGREVTFRLEKDRRPPGGAVVLEVAELRALNDKGLPAVNNVSFTVSKGEIVGVAGVAGNGQRELVEVIAGLRKAVGGEVRIAGKNVVNRSPREVRDQGVAYVPADRIGRGMLGEMSVQENLILGAHAVPPFRSGGLRGSGGSFFLNWAAVGSNALEQIQCFQIKAASKEAPARSLSGGNIQKLILARELMKGAKLLICEEPTQGLDVGATEYVHRLLLEERGRGKAVLLVSSDLDEVMSLSDRIVVMFNGEIAGALEGEAVEDVIAIGRLMTGVGPRTGHGEEG